MEPFELSISPVFNEVIRAAEVLDSDTSDQLSHDELAQALKGMAEFIQFLAASFQQAMQVRPKTELAVRAPKEFEKELKQITGVLSGIKEAAGKNDTSRFPELLENGRLALKNMFAIFEEMKKEEESFPVFSKSPYIQELVRIATGVAKGQYKPEVLKDKVSWLRDRWLEFKDDFSGMKNIPKENEDVEKLIPIAEQALSRMGNALDLMVRFQKNYDKKLLKDGCSELLQSSEVLIAVQERIMKASTAQPAACPNCGTLNPGGAKKCRNCSAQLPEIVGLSTQTMEFKENTENENRGPSYTYLVRLEGAVQSFRRDLIGEEDLKREIDFFAGKVNGGMEQFDQMKKKSAENKEESENPQVQECYAAMGTGLEMLSKGARQLQNFFTSKDALDLDKGLELVSEGAGQMIQAQSQLQS